MSLEDKAKEALKELDELDRVTDEVIAQKAASAGLSIEDWKLKVQQDRKNEQAFNKHANFKRPELRKDTAERGL